jgi:PAS domain S-box-containing protein
MSLPLQYFQKLVESCPDIIIAVDKRGTVTFYNDGARQNLGFSPDEVLGKNVLEIYPTMGEARRVMSAMRADDGDGKGRVRNFETNFKTKKGDKFPSRSRRRLLTTNAATKRAPSGSPKIFARSGGETAW